MRRGQINRTLRFRKALQFELLEARSLLAADLSNPFLFEGKECVRNELLVQYAPETVAPQGKLALIPIDATVTETIHTKTMRASGMGVLERVTLGAGVDMKAAIEEFKKNPKVQYVGPNYIYRPSVVSNDTYYTNGSLWGMYSDDLPSAVGPSGTTNQFGSQAEKAWRGNITGSKDVVIGVIDEGIQFEHPDLIQNMWLNPFEIPGNGLDDDENGYIDDMRGWDFYSNDNSVYDGTSDDHGTHVAGTIGGKGGNGTGVVGVAWDVTMISVKFLGPDGGTTEGAIKAIDYVTDLKQRHGLNIVATSNSWGGGGYDEPLHEAIIRSANANILFVAAAGNATNNNDVTPFYPAGYDTSLGTPSQPAASYDAVISVASITNTGAISGFSSYGAKSVDIGAPGSGIWSTVPSNAYGAKSGTSMATPHVTGAIALYASTQQPGISASSIRQAILSSATPTASLAGKTVTGGRLNAFNAVYQPIRVSRPSPTAKTTEGGGGTSFTVVLGEPPAANVTIPISSSDTSEGTVNLSSIVFTPANWDIPQTVTVIGVNDNIDDGNINYSIVLGAAISTDTKINGYNPTDVSLTNEDDDTAGITLSAPSGTVTTEAGDSITFTIRLNTEPMANVTIPISSSDLTEGTVFPYSLIFTPANWNVEQTVTVTGVDDTIYDGDIAYTVLVRTAGFSDSAYSLIDPPDFSLTNIDNDPAPSKFFVVDDGIANRNYGYDGGGNATTYYSLMNANATPRGMATNAFGNRVWILDSNRTVYVYDNKGALLGSWAAGGMPSSAVVEGITTNGTHIWIVDSGSDRVYYYPNAAARLTGTQNATSNFLLNASNRNPKDIVTDGIYIWVVNDTSADRVFRYTMNGILQNSWPINTANASPTGIALDLSGETQDIWIVDNASDRVYRYANARTLAAPTLVSSLALSAENTNPQGLINSPSGRWFDTIGILSESMSVGSSSNQLPADLNFATAHSGRKQETLSTQRDASFSLAAREIVSLASFVSAVKSEPTVAAAGTQVAIGGLISRATQPKSTKLATKDLLDQVFADIGEGLA